MESTVCIIDDDDAVRDSLTGLLEAYGYKVRAFHSPGAAFATDAVARCGCLLLDLHMPQSSGFEVIDRLRHGDRPSPPIVVITGKVNSASRHRAMEAGVAAFLEKPFDGDELLKTVAALTARA